MRKKRLGEKTCTCHAYKFPHRFGGGKCTGIYLLENNYPCQFCKTCSLNVWGECQVLAGAESVKECSIWQDHVNFWEIKI